MLREITPLSPWFLLDSQLVRSGREGFSRAAHPSYQQGGLLLTPPTGGPAAVKMFETLNKPDWGITPITSIFHPEEGTDVTPELGHQRRPYRFLRALQILGHPTRDR